jgi:uncharacterized membrane protein required for colicin V production
MTIWLLALILLASLAGLGYRQGVVRVAFSLMGILVGALLAVPAGKLVRPLLVVFNVKDPILAWALPPLIAFIIISMIFKGLALPVHLKVDVYFKYRAGDLRLALYERLHRRLGLCLGIVNGTAYLVLISFVIYALSYWTYQMATSENDPKLVRLVNRMGRDLETTGFNKVARAIDSLPKLYFETADVAGLIYHNSLLAARLGRYPGFFKLAEQAEFAGLSADKEFTEMWQRQEPIGTFIQQARIQAILQNPDSLKVVWDTVVPDLADLRVYLETGKSAKYSDKILGRWRFNVIAVIPSIRRHKPNIKSSEMQKARRAMLMTFEKTSFTAWPDHTAIIKDLPPIKLPSPLGTAPGGTQPLTGEWKGIDGDNYEFTFRGALLTGVTDGNRLTMKGKDMEMDLVFDSED